MPVYLLDTDIWIAVIRGMPAARGRLAGLRPDQLRMSYFVMGELEVGRHLAQRPSQQHALDELAARVAVNPVDGALATTFGRIAADLRSKGTQIGFKDTWIAAEALRYDQTLVTANVTEFERVPGLRVENWLG